MLPATTEAAEVRATSTTNTHLNMNQIITKTAETVVVAVRAEKEISKSALAWAITHVVRPGDFITLLAVLSSESKGKRLWSNFPRFAGDCGSSHRDMSPDDRICEISETCSQMVLQFHDQNQVCVRIKVVSGGVVAAESRRAGANWVVLDKQLKHEEKHCMEELHCNIVVMKRSQAKVLRLNLGNSNDFQPPASSYLEEINIERLQSNRIRHSTPVSSPEDLKISFTRTTNDETSISSSDAGTSPFFVCEQNPLFEGHRKERIRPIYELTDSEDSFVSFDSEGECPGPLITNSTSSRTLNHGNVQWITQNNIVNKQKSFVTNFKDARKIRDTTPRTLLEQFVQFDQAMPQQLDRTNERDHIFNSNVRDAVSISRISTAPPPLCTLCQHKAPVFGKPPRWFDYRELEEATDRFSEANFLADGGLVSVHRGMLSDGQVVAVKQFKVVGSQGDTEFCREVGMLSCAQHRNVEMLIGFCMEGRKRVLVFEYVCNGSLDSHLYGSRRAHLDWQARYKIAIGAARGLRYLHEDCRVGCIVHRHLHPNNILLTHDFEPLVGDFGLARQQPELGFGAESRTVGNLRFLAPEYADDANITDKADVYGFGVLLLDLITGGKTADMHSLKGQQFLAEWSHLLLVLAEQSQAQTINSKLVDPFLDPVQLQDFSHQLKSMARAASLCLQRYPESRPPMSKVLRTLEEGDAIGPFGLDLDPIGNRSGRLRGLSSNPQTKLSRNHSRELTAAARDNIEPFGISPDLSISEIISTESIASSPSNRNSRKWPNLSYRSALGRDVKRPEVAKPWVKIALSAVRCCKVGISRQLPCYDGKGSPHWDDSVINFAKHEVSKWSGKC